MDNKINNLMKNKLINGLDTRTLSNPVGHYTIKKKAFFFSKANYKNLGRNECQKQKLNFFFKRIKKYIYNIIVH